MPTEIRMILQNYLSMSLSDLQTIALIVLGFSAMLRWDELHRLRRSNLSFFDDHMTIYLVSRKNDQF